MCNAGSAKKTGTTKDTKDNQKALVSFVSFVYFVVEGLASRLDKDTRLLNPLQDLRRFRLAGNMHRTIPIHVGWDQLIA